MRDSTLIQINYLWIVANGASDGTYLKPKYDQTEIFNQISSKLLQEKEKIATFYALVYYQSKFYPKIESFFSKHIQHSDENKTIYK